MKKPQNQTDRILVGMLGHKYQLHEVEEMQEDQLDTTIYASNLKELMESKVIT